MLNDNDRKIIEKDVLELLEKKLGHKKFLVCIAFHSSGNEDQATISSFVSGNVNFGKDPFNLTKTLLAGMQTSANQFCQQIMGVATAENKPMQSSYHQ